MGVRATVPRSVQAAAILSYVSAGLAFIGGAVINLALQLPASAGFGAGIFWLFMAASIRIGPRYMHFVATFVFALGTVVTMFEPLNEVLFQAVGATPYLIVFETVQWLPALAAIVLLWTRGTAAYYRQAENRARQQAEQLREERTNRDRVHDRRKRARRASARSRSLSRR